MSKEESKTDTKEHQELISLGKSADVGAFDKNLAVIDKRFGDGQEYDLFRIKNEIETLGNTATQVMLELGRRFILIKEHEKPGNYMKALDDLGYKPRVVQKIMQAALKFGDAPTLAHLGKSKLFELMTEDDEIIEELKETGSIGDLELDDIERMSIRELRHELKLRNKKFEKLSREHAEKIEEVNALEDMKQQAVAGSEYPSWVSLMRKEVPVYAEEASADIDSIANLSATYLENVFHHKEKADVFNNAAVYPALAHLASIASHALATFHSLCESHTINPEDIASFVVPMEADELALIDGAVEQMMHKRRSSEQARIDSYRQSGAVSFKAGRPAKHA